MQGDATNELHVIRHHVPGGLAPDHAPAASSVPTAGFLDHAEGLRQQIVDGLVFLQPVAELLRFGLQGLFGQLLVTLGVRVDLSDDRLHAPEVTFRLRLEDFLEKLLEHVSWISRGRRTADSDR